MAEEVLDRLGNMKLTAEEEEVIAISDEGRLEEMESCSLSLVGKFLTCKAFNKRAAWTTLRKAWGVHTGLQIIEVGSNLFQFKFQSEFEMCRVLRGGPWTFDNQLLMLKKWHKRMTASNVRLEHASLWVQIWGAPFDMISPQVATEVGKRLGVVEEVERRKVRDIQKNFMRVRVALPISKPLRRGSYIADSSGERTWVNFKYERLPIFCFFCGLLEQDVRHCANHFSVEKNGGEVDYQYGEWLKALGGRSRSPPRSPPQDGGAENEQSSDTWEIRRPVSQGVDKPQHMDNPEVYAENMGTQGKGIQ
ncbi:uncharacterized protein LOC115966576 [Quercus lobata]|uniref:uncharacterized protein LOC115966576 n=1 Tax=Quercus lobata TaxID=97700 RepID=UPI00124524B8|nr:uncharacterized protein LOC115966576 [Quercus lobata]